MRKKLFKLSVLLLAVGIVVLLISFFCFHFVTEEGITLIWQKEASKPTVSLLIGVLGATLMGHSILSLLCGILLFEKEENK